MMRCRCISQAGRLAWVTLATLMFVYLSVSYNDADTVTSDEVKAVLSACRTLQHQIESSHYPYGPSQYSKSFLFLPPKTEMLKISKKHKISICVPYKAGSETWRYLVGSLTNSTQSQEDLDDIEQIKDYLKAIQIRDPYERLLSAYRFIFNRGNVLKDNYMFNKHLLDHYDFLEHDLDTEDKPVASFAQFVQSIVTGYEDLPASLHHLLTEGAALHWLPYYVQCNPCHPSYTPNTVININNWHQDTQTFLNTADINTNRY